MLTPYRSLGKAQPTDEKSLPHGSAAGSARRCKIKTRFDRFYFVLMLIYINFALGI